MSATLAACARKCFAPVHEGHRGGDRPSSASAQSTALSPPPTMTTSWPACAAELLDEVGQPAALPLVAAGQRARGEGADAAGDHDGAAGDPGAPVGGDDEPLTGARAVPGLVGQVLGPLAEQVDRVEAGGLRDEPGDQVAALDRRGSRRRRRPSSPGRARSPGRRARGGCRRSPSAAAEARVVGGVEPGRAGADDEQVDLDRRGPRPSCCRAAALGRGHAGPPGRGGSRR